MKKALQYPMNKKVVARLTKMYSYETAQAIEAIVKVGDAAWLSLETVRAYKANLTRGTYDGCLY